MFSIALAFVLPYMTGYIGWVRWLVWALAVDFKWSPPESRYGVRLRVLGVTAIIDVFLPKNEGNTPQIGVSATKIGENGEETEIELPPDGVEFFKYLHSLKVRMVIGDVASWNADDKSFTLPSHISDQLGIGSRILFGDKESGFIVAVTGSKKLEDDKTLHYAKFVEYANPELNETTRG